MAIKPVGAALGVVATYKPREGAADQPRLPADTLETGKHPNAGDIAKIGGKTALGAFVGWVGTAIYDLFFHFGNNGGTSYGKGVYAGFAAAGAAIGAWLGIRKYQKQHGNG